MIAWRAAWHSTPCVHCAIIQRYAHMARGAAPSQALHCIVIRSVDWFSYYYVKML